MTASAIPWWCYLVSVYRVCSLSPVVMKIGCNGNQMKREMGPLSKYEGH